jgi:hypothetical protein
MNVSDAHYRPNDDRSQFFSVGNGNISDGLRIS